MKYLARMFIVLSVGARVASAQVGQAVPADTIKHALAIRLARIVQQAGAEAYASSLGSVGRGSDSVNQNAVALAIAAHTAKYVPRDTIVEVMAQAYEAGLSASELRELIAFYTGPLGKKYLDLQPQVIAAVRQTSSALLADHGLELQRMLEAAVPRPAKPNDH